MKLQPTKSARPSTTAGHGKHPALSPPSCSDVPSTHVDNCDDPFDRESRRVVAAVVRAPSRPRRPALHFRVGIGTCGDNQHHERDNQHRQRG